MNIILCGYMGCGKTTVGKKLAKLKGMKFTDTDAVIESMTGMKISEIFEKNGEEYFRKLECDVSETFAKMKNTVIATGGGFMMNEKARENARAAGVTVYLYVSDKTILKRVFNKKGRPVIEDKSAQDIITLYNNRKKTYALSADIIVDANKYANKTAGEIAERIAGRKN